MKTTQPLASFSTRIPLALLLRLEALRRKRARQLGRRVRVQDVAQEAIERLVAAESNHRVA